MICRKARADIPPRAGLRAQDRRKRVGRNEYASTPAVAVAQHWLRTSGNDPMDGAHVQQPPIVGLARTPCMLLFPLILGCCLCRLSSSSEACANTRARPLQYRDMVPV